MTGTPDADRIESLTDPATLVDRDGVAVETVTESVAAADLPDAEALDSQVVVGVADDRGVLLYDDGHHGWTPPAFPVDPGEDYAGVARRAFEALTGVGLSIDRVAFLRERVFRASDGAEVTVWNVLLAATPDERLPDDPESRLEDAEIAWFDGAPDGVPEPVAADVERISDQP